MILVCTNAFGYLKPGDEVEVPDAPEGHEVLYDHAHFTEREPEPVKPPKKARAADVTPPVPEEEGK